MPFYYLTHAIKPRRRNLQENLQTIEVVGRGQSNNRNIEIANDSDGSETSEMEFEDTIINRKKFRVPEKVIRLDFWEKLKKERDVVQTPVTVQEEMSADEQDAQGVCFESRHLFFNVID